MMGNKDWREFNMGELIKSEIKKVFKSRKNKILLIALILSVLLVNIYYIGKHRSFVEELEKETTMSKNSAQIRIRKALTEISRFESEDEATKQLLQKEYGSLEKIEEAKELLEIEVQRNKKESSYVQIPFILQKQLKPRKGKVVENEEEIIREILDAKIKRTNNIIEANEEGLVPESALKLRKITMDDIRRKNVYYNYLKENNIKYNPNPYTNTGIFSIATLLDNNML